MERPGGAINVSRGIPRVNCSNHLAKEVPLERSESLFSVRSSRHAWRGSHKKANTSKNTVISIKTRSKTCCCEKWRNMDPKGCRVLFSGL